MLPFFDEEELLKPCSIVRERNNMPKNAIIMWSFSLFNALKDKIKSTTLSTFKCGIHCPVYSFTYKSREIACVLLPIGAPVAAGFIEEYFAGGVKNFVCIGSCGSLSPSTHGNIIVPTYAYRDEGTSWHYAPHDSPWIKVNSAIQTHALLDSLLVPHICGKVWTCDAFYRETPSAIGLMKEQGCLAVEMECAATMAVSQYRGAECYQMLFPEDLLDGTSWSAGSMGKRNRSMNDRLAQIALDVASMV